MKKLLTLIGAAGFAAMSANAAVITVFDNDDSAFSTSQGTDFESYTLIDQGSGDYAMNLQDFNNSDKTSDGGTASGVKAYNYDVFGDGSALEEAVQISLSVTSNEVASNKSTAIGSSSTLSTSAGFKIRTGNSTYSISSSSNTMTGIEWREDNNIVLKSNLDSDASDIFAFAQSVTYQVDIFANYSASQSIFNFNGTDLTLDVDDYALFIDGTLYGTAVNQQSATDLGGFNSIGFFMDSNKVGGDFTIDDVLVGYGADFATNLSAVPEPSTYAAIFGAIALAFAVRRKKRA